MIVPKEIRTAFNDSLPLVKATSERVRDIVHSYCEKNAFLFDDRLKSIESLGEKIESGRYSSWAQIDDLYACTIIVPLLSDEPKVISFLKSEFREKTIRSRKTANKAPDAFRFDSARFYGYLRQPEGMADQTGTIYNIPFECQIKTVFDFAWGKVSHALAYKSAQIGWGRQRLVAQMKATVEQLDMLTQAFESNVDVIPESPWEEITAKKQISEFFKSLVDQEKLPREIQPNDWTRFADNVYRAYQVFSKSRRVPAHTISSFEELFREYFDKTDKDSIPRSISLFQTVVGIIGATGQYNGKDSKYSMLVTESFQTLFPGADLPGKPFKIDCR